MKRREDLRNGKREQAKRKEKTEKEIEKRRRKKRSAREADDIYTKRKHKEGRNRNKK